MAISQKVGFNLPHLSDAPQSVANENPGRLELPAAPAIRIRANNRLEAIDLRELWAHRELVYFLVWRDLKVRYKQTVLGASWVILQPVLMTLVFAIFLGNIARVPSNGVPYILFLYSGLLPWIYFSNAVSSSSHSLIASANMITKVYFPRSIVPLAAVLVRLSDFLIASAILIVLIIYYGQPLSWSILLAPLLIVQLTLLAFALSLWFSALNVKYRDVGSVLPVVLQLWMFASPIIYPSSLVAPKWRWAYALNPLTGIVGGFRSALFNHELDLNSLLISLAITLGLFAYSAFAFRRMEDDFADVV
jgi:lipopolysaccharide transport system permease protein